MTESRYLDLMQGEIDGENSKDESAALQEYLFAHPEARASYSELLHLAGELDRMPALDPPADFKDSVLRRIRIRRHEAARMPFRTGIFQARRNALKYACAMAAGLILGALLAPFLSDAVRGGNTMDFSQLPGAMISRDVFKGATVVERAIQAENVSGRVQARRSGASLLVELEIHAGQKVDLALEYDPRHFQFRGLENSEQTASAFQSFPDRLTWTQLDRLRCRILMSVPGNESQSLHLRVLASDRTIYESVFQLPGLTSAVR